MQLSHTRPLAGASFDEPNLVSSSGLAVTAFTLTRAASTLTGGRHATAATGTIRRQLVHVPARIASSARRLVLHLPTGWPWQTVWSELFTRSCGPPQATTT